MKKIMMLIVCVMFMGTAARADDDKPVTVNQLPQAAQEFINQYFANISVSYAKVEEDFAGKTYDVIFSNGSKVEFNRKGMWTDVNCQREAVPSGVVPTAILSYVSDNHGDANVVEIDRDKIDFELKLSNGAELVFDLKGKFVRFD